MGIQYPLSSKKRLMSTASATNVTRPSIPSHSYPNHITSAATSPATTTIAALPTFTLDPAPITWYGFIALGDDDGLAPIEDSAAEEAAATNEDASDEEKRPVEAAEKDALESVVFAGIEAVEVMDASRTVRVTVEVEVMVVVVVAEEDWAAASGERSMRKARRNLSAERMLSAW
ncbi:hypothetical protein MMC32_007794 [Xylographa parallela]|nr:hypothetical protein [Xylographa parallela]